MRIFAIGDTHLGASVDKPMDLFGRRWENHTERLATEWSSIVRPEDVVLVAGDISWALKLEEAIADLAFLDKLPGRKILLRGNHDYWWSSLNKVETLCRDQGFESLSFLQNKAIILDDNYVVAGSRLWMLEDDARFTKQDGKILARETGRLGLSLDDAKLKQGKRELIVMTHYPPFEKNLASTQLTKMIKEAGALAACYGHIHREDSPYCLEGKVIDGVPYTLVSADYLAFKPYLLVG